MKQKIMFLFALLCMVCIGAKAAEVSVSTQDELATAVTNASSGDVITLGADVALKSTQSIDKSLTINLNGHNITATDCRAIWQKEGTLTLSGTGTISAAHTASNTSFASSSSVIRVGDNAGTAAGLVVGENVTYPPTTATASPTSVLMPRL